MTEPHQHPHPSASAPASAGLPLTILVMGVSGCGKSTLATALAAQLRGRFIEADAFHPAANIAKMSAGIALSDADRLPWLEALNAALRGTAAGQGERSGAATCSDSRIPPVPVQVLACSALKARYRQILLEGLGQTVIVFLNGSRDELAERLAHRSDHFMSPALLDSQLATLEPPVGAIEVGLALAPQAAVALVLAELRQRGINLSENGAS